MDNERRQQEPGASLSNAPDVQQNFAHANMAQQPLEKPTPGPDQKSRMSLAQQTDPIQALTDRKITQEQNRAADPVVQAYQSRLEGQPKPQPAYSEVMKKVVSQVKSELGSDTPEMIKKQAPAPALKPKTPVGRAADAQAFNQAWATEQKRAAAYQDLMRKAYVEEKRDQAQAAQQNQSMNQGYSL